MKLLPCKYCGAMPVIEYTFFTDVNNKMHKRWYACCPECKEIIIQTGYCNNKTEAKTEWNSMQKDV